MRERAGIGIYCSEYTFQLQIYDTHERTPASGGLHHKVLCRWPRICFTRCLSVVRAAVLTSRV